VCASTAAIRKSIHFFHGVGLDYVSCSPFRVPIARLEAGRAAVSPHSTIVLVVTTPDVPDAARGLRQIPPQVWVSDFESRGTGAKDIGGSTLGV